MPKCVKQNIIVHFIIQKLKNKHIFLKTEKAKSSHFDRTRGYKNQKFPTLEIKYALIKFSCLTFGTFDLNVQNKALNRLFGKN